jgi:DNA modification methylase
MVDKSVQIINDNCLNVLSKMDDNCIDLLVTSPPYFNAREYSQFETVEDYMEDMKNIFIQVYRVLKNHHNIVVNVGDITAKVGKQSHLVRKLPLGSMFTNMLENIGFIYIDDYIWDKGEPQSKRHIGNPPYPFYQYPVNCYEHILIFAKHKLDKTKLKCPVCGSDNVQSNSLQGIGVYSFECKNKDCPTKSPSGRGKRFSARSIMMNDYQKEENRIDDETKNKFRRDIVRITPVIKINGKGENKIGHTAPYPIDIPEMAIKYYSGVGDVVVDPFLGSGTTGVASVNLNRNFIGIELNKEYFEIANKRINEVKNKITLF